MYASDERSVTHGAPEWNNLAIRSGHALYIWRILKSKIALMNGFGIFCLTLGLAFAASLTGYGLMRLFMRNYFDTSLALIWEAVWRTPYQPLSGRMVLIGLAISGTLIAVGALLLRPERKRIERRVIVGNLPPDPPAS